MPVKIFEPKLIEKLFPSMQEVIDEIMRKLAFFRQFCSLLKMAILLHTEAKVPIFFLLTVKYIEQ